MIKKLLKFLFSPFLGKVWLQKFFKVLHLLALKGMNYGGGADFRDSGEEWVLKYVNMRRHDRNPFVLFDVGANEGGYAVAAIKILADCKIYAFEPSPEIFNMLKIAVANFPNIQAVNIGLSSKPAQADLFVSQAASGLTSLYDRQVFKQENLNMDRVQVSLDTLDNFCARNNIGRVNFLKLDVEGHELEVLKGAKGMIENRKINYIQFEFGGTDVDARVFLKDFFELLAPNYSISRILKNGLEPVNYDENKEIFTTTNYLAELKS